MPVALLSVRLQDGRIAGGTFLRVVMPWLTGWCTTKRRWSDFKQLVEGALAHQRVQSSEHTTFYVVNLLAAFVCPQREAADALQEPLGLPTRARAADRRRSAARGIAAGRRRVALSRRVLRRQPDPQARRRRLLRHAGWLRLRLAQSSRRRRVRTSLFRAGREVHPFRRRPVRGERPQLHEFQHGSAPALREVAADTESSQRRFLLLERGIVPNHSLHLRRLH